MTKSVHLVLSSGGVRTLGYAGALQAMERAEIEVATVSAVSAGAVVGALVADDKTGDELVDLFTSPELDLVELAGAQPGPLARLWALRKWPFAPDVAPAFTEFIVANLGGDKTFEELARPFATMGVDIMAGEYLVYTRNTHPRMRVSEAVGIATALPVVTHPYEKGKRVVVDAAISTRSPVWLTAAVEDEETADLPIVVLRPAPVTYVRVPQSVPSFIRRLIDVTAIGRDLLFLRGNPRVHTIDLPTGAVQPRQFDLSVSARRRLVELGREEAARRIDAVDGDFASIQPHISSAAAHLPGGELADQEANDEEKAAWGGSHYAQRFHSTSPPEIFISYAREDAGTLADLVPHLTPHARIGGSFSSWTDAEIRPGEDWEHEIRDAIGRAKAALVLVSQHFLASDFIKDYEFPQLAQAERERRLPLIPLFIDDADLGWSKIDTRQGVNTPDRPLAEIPLPDREAELARIAKEVARRVTVA